MSISHDCYFNLPLFYSISTSQGNLYAYNEPHLEYLESFISATIRKRTPSKEYGWSNQSQISRLPRWVKLAKNRAKLLKAIKKLRKQN